MKDFNRVVRYLAYVLELLVLFMVQETPGMLPAIFGVRPVLLLPAAVTIAMYEDETPAMAFGIMAGLFCDFGLSGTLGFHAIVLAVLCYLVSCVTRVYFQVNLATALLTGAGAIMLILCAQWLFLYYFKYSMAKYAFVHHYLPKFFYTMLFVPLLYLLNRGLSLAVSSQESAL